MKYAVALTTVLLFFTSCGKGKPPMNPSDHSVSAEVRREDLNSDQKMQLVASRIDEMQKQICCISTENVQGTWGGKVAPHNKNMNLYVTGDYLYWKASEDGLALGELVDNLPGNPATNTNSHRIEPNFQWNSGFRVGAGMKFGEDLYDLYASYNHINNFAKKHEKAGPTQKIIPAWGSFLLGGSTNYASSQWHLNFTCLDLEMGRDFFAGKKFAVRPHLGVRAAEIKQNYHANYNSTIASTVNKFVAENKYKGIGACVGTDLMWHLNKHFGLYGEISGSLLYGRFTVREHMSQAPAAGLMTTFTEKDTFWNTAANLQGAIGFSFPELLTIGDFTFAIDAVYELSEWFNQNRLIGVQQVVNSTSPSATTFETTQQHGDLGFQGGTIRLIVGF